MNNQRIGILLFLILSCMPAFILAMRNTTEGNFAFSIAAPTHNVLAQAASSENMKMINLLLKDEKWVKEIDVPDLAGYTALHYAVVQGKMNAAAALLKAGADPNKRNHHDGTCLQMVILSGHYNNSDKRIKMIELLLKYDADIDLQDDEGRTPLIEALCLNDPAIVKFLIQNNADILLKTKTGSSAAQFAEAKLEEANIANMLARNPRSNRSIIVRNRNKIQEIFNQAPQRRDGQAQASKKMEKESTRPAKQNQTKASEPLRGRVQKDQFAGKAASQQAILPFTLFGEDNSTLHNAVQNGSIAAATALLKAGANANELHFVLGSCLNMVIMCPCYQTFEQKNNMFKLLLKYHADINLQDDQGMTPLMSAIYLNDPDVVEFLIQNNADILSKSRKGYNAIEYAASELTQDKIEVIQQHYKLNIGKIIDRATIVRNKDTIKKLLAQALQIRTTQGTQVSKKESTLPAKQQPKEATLNAVSTDDKVGLVGQPIATAKDANKSVTSKEKELKELKEKELKELKEKELKERKEKERKEKSRLRELKRQKLQQERDSIQEPLKAEQENTEKLAEEAKNAELRRRQELDRQEKLKAQLAQQEREEAEQKRKEREARHKKAEDDRNKIRKEEELRRQQRDALIQKEKNEKASQRQAKRESNNTKGDAAKNSSGDKKGKTQPKKVSVTPPSPASATVAMPPRSVKIEVVRLERPNETTSASPTGIELQTKTTLSTSEQEKQAIQTAHNPTQTTSKDDQTFEHQVNQYAQKHDDKQWHEKFNAACKSKIEKAQEDEKLDQARSARERQSMHLNDQTARVIPGATGAAPVQTAAHVAEHFEHAAASAFSAVAKPTPQPQERQQGKMTHICSDPNCDMMRLLSIREKTPAERKRLQEEQKKRDDAYVAQRLADMREHRPLHLNSFDKGREKAEILSFARCAWLLHNSKTTIDAELWHSWFAHEVIHGPGTAPIIVDNKVISPDEIIDWYSNHLLELQTKTDKEKCAFCTQLSKLRSIADVNESKNLQQMINYITFKRAFAAGRIAYCNASRCRKLFIDGKHQD